MKRVSLLMILSGLIAQTAAAQGRNLAEKQQIVNTLGNPNQQGSLQTFDERYKRIRGNPFLSERRVDGKVRMRNGHVFDELQIKYDLYRDQLVVKRRDGAEVIPEKARIQEFVLTPRAKDSLHFIRIDYLSNYRKFPTNQFAQVLYEGESALLAVHRKKLIKADYQGAYRDNCPYDLFGEAMATYHFIDSDGKAAKLKPSHKHITRLLKNKIKVVNRSVTEEGIDFEDSHDLVRLIRYYDQH